MNGAKVLNRLIQLFILFNLILFVINLAKSTNTYLLTKQRIDNIQKISKSKGIILEEALPRAYTPKKSGTILGIEMNSEESIRLAQKLLNSHLGDLTISTEIDTSPSAEDKENRTYSNGDEKLTVKNNEIIYTSLSTEKKYKEMNTTRARRLCQDFISKADFGSKFSKKHIEERTVGESMELTYYADFEGYPLFNSYIRFWVGEEGIREAIIHMVHIDTNVGQKGNIYPIDLVLFGIEEEIPVEFSPESPLYITEITLGYYTLTTEGMRILAEEIVPTYKITIKGLEKPLFVNAYTNKFIK